MYFSTNKITGRNNSLEQFRFFISRRYLFIQIDPEAKRLPDTAANKMHESNAAGEQKIGCIALALNY